MNSPLPDWSHPPAPAVTPPTPGSAPSPDLVGITAAASARVYDYLLGGKDNYAVDRDLVDRILAIQPGFAQAAHENRRFLARAVGFLAGYGIRRFLDVGCGLPTRDNTHQIALRKASDAQVIYIDNDPVVLVHARALLAGGDHITAIQADLRDPDQILCNTEVGSMLASGEPVALLLTAVLHHLGPADDAHQVVKHLREALPPGSVLVISHTTADAAPTATAQAAHLYTAGCDAPLVPRSRDEVRSFFGDLTLLDPGLVFTTQWRPDGPVRSPEHALAYAAIGLCGAAPAATRAWIKDRWCGAPHQKR